MPFIHVIAGKLVVSQRAKHAHAADAQQHFLTKAVIGIAAIKTAGEAAVGSSGIMTFY